MKAIDKYERVAALAINARTRPSAYTVANVVCQLERIAKAMRRTGDAVANGTLPGDGVEMRRLLGKAVPLAATLGFLADESDDGMGYLRIVLAHDPVIAVAIFGDE